jgi:predicted nucleic-acid-binding protein
MGGVPGITRQEGDGSFPGSNSWEHRRRTKGQRVKAGLDTSVVLRLLLGQPADQAARAVAFLDKLARGGHRAVVCDLVVAEVYFALQHHYGVSKQDALLGLRRLFADGEIQPLGAAAEVLAVDGMASAKPGFVDRLIHGAYAGAAEEMVTFEKTARKLKSVRVLWPEARANPFANLIQFISQASLRQLSVGGFKALPKEFTVSTVNRVAGRCRSVAVKIVFHLHELAVSWIRSHALI